MADFLHRSAVLHGKRPFCAFEPLKGGLGATYEVHLRLIGKRVGLLDFLIVLIELFAKCYTAEALRANIDWKSAISLKRGKLDPKFQVEGVAPINHSSSQKTRLNDLSYGVKIWRDLSSVLSQSTRSTDGHRDTQTERRIDTFLVASLRWHSMQRGKNRSVEYFVVHC